jgi:DNA-binding NarL/FixJ family response regulator
MPARPPGGDRHRIRAGTIRVLLAGSPALTRGDVPDTLDASDDIDIVGTAATDGPTLRLARLTRPDLVLLEQGQGLHVHATARRLLAEPDLPGVQVLLFGRYEWEEHVLAALRTGIGGLVDADCAPEQLLRAVRISAAGAAFVIPGMRRLAPLPPSSELLTWTSAAELAALSHLLRTDRTRSSPDEE